MAQIYWPINPLLNYPGQDGPSARPASGSREQAFPYLPIHNQPTNGVAASACFSIMIIRTLSFLMCVSGEFKGGQLLPRTPLGAECARNT